MCVVLPALLALILAGCGELATPVGDVTGRIVGALPGAYAYPLGRPDLKVDLVIGADGVGTYVLPAVPTSVEAIVLYDGAPRPDGDEVTPDGRAELVPVRISGGAVNPVADRYGAAAVLLPAGADRMPLAGALLAEAAPDGGATPWRPTFDLPQTVHGGLVPEAGGAREIWPLPAGRFSVAAALPGFVQGFVSDLDPRGETVVAGQTVPMSVPLPVDLGATRRGCDAVTVTPQCGNGLVCEPADGRCYECIIDAHCEDGWSCDAQVHACKPPALPKATYCSPCTSAATDCPSGWICRSGSCTTEGCSSDRDCAAGFECEDDVWPHFCKAPDGCADWIQTMGAACYSNYRCDDDLEHGWCQGATSEAPGFCTAECDSNADCQIGTGVASTFVCNLSATRPYCMPPP